MNETSELLTQAIELIDAAIELMTPEQVGQWAGVRAWQEQAGEAVERERMANGGMCESCNERPGVFNSAYWMDPNGDAGHWVCIFCEEEIEAGRESNCPCGCAGDRSICSYALPNTPKK